jgi:hypothetical protein
VAGRAAAPPGPRPLFQIDSDFRRRKLTLSRHGQLMGCKIGYKIGGATVATVKYEKNDRRILVDYYHDIDRSKRDTQQSCWLLFVDVIMRA